MAAVDTVEISERQHRLFQVPLSRLDVAKDPHRSDSWTPKKEQLFP
jgi:hypothetical protein